MDDREIIALFFARSERAIRELDQKHGGAVRRVASNILADGRDAEECVSDTWLAAWNTIPPQEPHPLRTYVCAVARNLALRKSYSNSARKRGGRYDAALSELEESVPALETVETEFAARELSTAINAFLDVCTPEDRIIFVRRYWLGDSISRIAATLNWTPHRVSVRLYRLRGKLQEFLEKEGMTA